MDDGSIMLRKKNPDQAVSDKILGSVTVNTFEPDLYETINVVQEFDQTLKFVTFEVTKEAIWLKSYSHLAPVFWYVAAWESNETP